MFAQSEVLTRPRPLLNVLARFSAETSGYADARTTNREEEDSMGDKGDRATGHMKEKLGQATGNPGLEQKGRDEQAKGDIKKSASKAKDAIKKQS